MWGDSVPNGSLQWSISCLVWFPWWPRHGAMDPSEGTLFRVNGDRFDVWIYTSNSLIRFSNVKQPALPFISLFTVARRSGRLCEPWESLSLLLGCHTEQPETFVYHRCSSFSQWNMTRATKGNRHVLFLQVWSFWYLVRSKYCAPNSFELVLPFNAHVAWTTTVPFWE